MLLEFAKIMVRQGDARGVLQTIGYMLQIAISPEKAQSCKNQRDPFESRDHSWIANSQKSKDVETDFSACFQQAIVEDTKFKKKEMLELVKNKVIP